MTTTPLLLLLAAPDALHDLDGHAFARRGVDDTAHYLIRPDGHIGYRAGGTDLDGLGRYLARWLPNPHGTDWPTTRPGAGSKAGPGGPRRCGLQWRP